MDYEQIRKELEGFVARLDIAGYREYIDSTTLKAKLTGDDFRGYYQRMVDIAKDLLTKEFIILLDAGQNLVYQSNDVMIYLEDGYLGKVWMRNEGKQTWRIIPEMPDDYGDDDEEEEGE